MAEEWLNKRSITGHQSPCWRNRKGVLSEPLWFRLWWLCFRVPCGSIDTASSSSNWPPHCNVWGHIYSSKTTRRNLSWQHFSKWSPRTPRIGQHCHHFHYHSWKKSPAKLRFSSRMIGLQDSRITGWGMEGGSGSRKSSGSNLMNQAVDQVE